MKTNNNILIALITIASLLFGCSDKEKRIIYYKSGVVKEEIELKNTVPNGEYKTFYETGNLESISNQKNGKLSGLSITYFEDGTVKSEQLYENGIRNGLSKFYYLNGNIAYEGVYLNGAEVGTHTEYYELDSGRVWNVIDYLIVNGKSEQIRGRKYDQNGNLSEESNWLNIETVTETDGQYVIFSIENPVYDSLNLTIGSYDDQFILRDSSTLKTYWSGGHSLKIRIEPSYGKYLRGFVNDYRVIDKSLDGSFETISSFIYFEYRI